MHQEIDLLLSSVPSPLIVALPFIFITNDLHIISSATLQNAQGAAQVAKLFFKPHVEDIKKEFFEIKAMGPGTAEEWLKGLDKRGKEKRNDAFKWERWEQTGGVRRMQSSERTWLQETDIQSKLAIATTSMATGEAIRSLAGNAGLKHPGASDATTKFSTYNTQAEQPISAPFCKFSSITTPYKRITRLTSLYSYEYSSSIRLSSANRILELSSAPLPATKA